jgi:putative colanic acid biosysnthesis UDP-glucose lipid carrier transferase
MLSINSLKEHKYTTLIPFFLMILDFIIILATLDILRVHWHMLDLDERSNLFLSVNIGLCWLVAGFLSGIYLLEHLDNSKKIIKRNFLSSIIYLVLIFALIGLRSESTIEPFVLFIISVILTFSIIFLKVIMLRIYKVIQHMSPSRKNVIIIGNSKRGKLLSKYFLTTTSLPLKYYGFFDNNIPSSVEEFQFYLGRLDDIKEFCSNNKINEIYFALDNNNEFLIELMTFADHQFIFLGIVPEIGDLENSRRLDAMLFNDSRIPIIASRKVPLHIDINWQIKRTFDVVFSAVVLIILSMTVFPIIAILIKLDSPGPILFRQLRPGRNNKLFWCYKFRTMKADSDIHIQATKNDSRVTKLGAFLRKTSLDELPQFFNVIKGEMSVVGPRPNLIVHLEKYPEEIKEYALRHWIVPGITGYAQVSGYRGETKETELMRKRIEFDLSYIENWSLALDIKIIAKTVINMFKGEEKAY